MRAALTVVVDRRLENQIVAWARRRWRVLRIVPAWWIRPAIAPAAVRMRRSLSRVALALALAGTILLALLGSPV
jgi:hypothetical protein